MNNESVDSYLEDGCGRCDKYQTPDCKVHRWQDELVFLRRLLRSHEVEETMKWGSPVYTRGGKNVVHLGALNDHVSLGFPKGVLLEAPDGLLEKPGPNTQTDRVVRLRTMEEVQQHEAAIHALVDQAIQLEDDGVEVQRKAEPEPVPDELQAVLDADDELMAAWSELTPGRRRSHVLHVGGAKKSDTRARRAEKCAEKIRQGKGFLDR